MVVILFAERHADEVEWLAATVAAALARTRRGGATAGVALARATGSAPPPPNGVTSHDLSELTPREMAERLRHLTSDGTFVVGAATGRTERALACFDAADVILLVADLTVPAIRGLQRSIKLCDSLGIARDRARVVLYDCREDAPVALGDAMGAIKRDIFAALPPGHDGPADMSSCLALAQRLLQEAQGRVQQNRFG
jgi:hypothetical protein